MKPSIFLVVDVVLGGLLIIGCASPANFAERAPVKPLMSERIGPDQSHSTIEPTQFSSQATLKSSPREHPVTPTWTISPGGRDSMPGAIFEADVEAEQPAAAAAPDDERPTAVFNAAEFNSPLPTPPDSPLPTPPDSPWPTPSEVPATPTDLPTATPARWLTATPTRTGSPTITRTPTGSVTPTYTRGPTVTPTGSTTPRPTPTEEVPTATPSDVPVSTPTLPDSPLPTPTPPNSPLPTPTGTCCYDCDC